MSDVFVSCAAAAFLRPFLETSWSPSPLFPLGRSSAARSPSLPPFLSFFLSFPLPVLVGDCELSSVASAAADTSNGRSVLLLLFWHDSWRTLADLLRGRDQTTRFGGLVCPHHEAGGHPRHVTTLREGGKGSHAPRGQPQANQDPAHVVLRRCHLSNLSSGIIDTSIMCK